LMRSMNLRWSSSMIVPVRNEDEDQTSEPDINHARIDILRVRKLIRSMQD
jgi:hypothetical protein